METLIYVVGTVGVGIVSVLGIRYVGGHLFPWEFDLRPQELELNEGPPNPEEADAKALRDIFSNLEDGYEVDLVMGEMNSKVVNGNVVKSLEEALRKDVKIRIINGPKVDEKTKIIDILSDPTIERYKSKIELYKLDKRPDLHFRVLINRQGDPEELYIEKPHKPGEDLGFWYLTSSQYTRRFKKKFEKLVKKAECCDT